MNEQTIFKGDIVHIKSQGVTRTGKVLSADYDSHRGNYYLEIDSTEAGYCYWKQGQDGGTVEKVAA